MRFTRVCLDTFAYELPDEAVTSAALEQRLAPAYAALHVQPGQLEALTGIRERRYWPRGQSMAAGAALAGHKALQASRVKAADIGMLVYGGVCRDNLEPATGCAVAHALGLPPHTQIIDVSNACLGVMNGIVLIANAIELGQIRAGIVVSCESARQIVDITITRLLREPTMDNFKYSLATLTGGSGAAAVIVSDLSLSPQGHRLLGGVVRCAPQHHELCRWGPDTGIPATSPLVMRTDSVGVLEHGIRLGVETFAAFREELEWPADAPDKTICHQVGAAHREAVLRAVELPTERDFVTYTNLGNIGTVSLPLTAAIADERGFLNRGDRVGFLGIGSGLNCLMLGAQW